MLEVNQIWKTIWSLGIPNKIRNFLWRASLDILPTSTKLVDHKIPASPRCRICGAKWETPLHIFVLCSWSKLIWESSEVSILTDKFFLDFRQLFEFMCKSMSVANIELWGVIFWLMWGNRNAVVHGRDGKDPLFIILFAKQYLQEYRDAQQLLMVVNPGVARVGAAIWLPPAEGFVKLNIDGILVPGEEVGGIGGVMRDYKGEVLGGFARCLSHCSSVLFVEAMAFLYGVVFVKESGISDLVVEGDNLAVVSAIANPDMDRFAVGHIIDEIKQCLVGF
uniref:Reverse transcriptase zinc-binding domain-containing protein n=1 Tax=Davidia involucrata TaxID=16924 RepID=A0A5B7BC05_DAVIN